MNAKILSSQFLVNSRPHWKAPKPLFNPYKINESSFADGMSYKECCTDFVENCLYIDWLAQNVIDRDGFVKEVCRWINVWMKFLPLEPFKVDISMSVRNARISAHESFDSENMPFKFMKQQVDATMICHDETQLANTMANIMEVGIKTASVSIARRLKSKGFPDEEICELTGLSKDDVDHLVLSNFSI